MKKNKPNRLFNMVNIVLVLTVVLSVPNFSSDYAGKVSAEDLEIIEAIGIPVIEDNAVDFEENTEKEISEIDTTETESVPTEITDRVLELDIDEQTNDSIENKQNTSENYSKNIMDELETNNANKEDETTNFTFEFTGEDGDSTATVSGYLGTSKSVTIPSEVTNYEAGWTKPSSVTAIKASAFRNMSLTDVIIPSSVTSIGDSAFRDNELTSVSLGNSVKSIGGYAFFRNELTSVSLGNSVTTIAYAAFSYNALTSITIPNSVTSIEEYAFEYNALTSVSLGNSVTSIGFAVFSENPLEKIKVSSEQIDRFKDLLTPSVMNGVTVRTILEAEESTENYSYAKGTLEEYKVNTANRTLDFEVTGPTRYQLGELSAFLWVEISPELSVEWYKNNVTTGNKTTKLTVSNVKKSQEGTYHAVVNGTKLADINVVVDDYVFEFTGEAGDSTATVSGYRGTSKSVSIPSTVTNYEAGWAKESSVTAIGKSAFWKVSLTDVIIPSSVTSIGLSAFEDNALTSVTIPDSVTSIGQYAFFRNELTSVSLGNSVKSIGSSAFRGNALTSVTIPDSVTSIGGYAFYSNPLEKIKVSSKEIDRMKDLLTPSVMDGVTVRTILEPTEGSENYSYAKGTLEEYKVNTTNRTLDFEVTGPTRYQLGDLTAHLWVEISPELSVEWYKNNVTTGNKTTKLTVSNVGKSQEGTYHAVVNGTKLAEINVVVDDYVFEFTGEDGDSTATVTGYLGTSKSVTIPSEVTNYEAGWTQSSPVTAIKTYAFESKNLTDVTIPNSVTIIEKRTFRYNALTSLNLGNSVTSIGDSAFESNNLTSVTIPNSVTSIGAAAFGNNELTSVILGNSVTSIGNYAFHVNNLTSINLPNSVTNIGDGAFQDSALETIKVSSKEIDRMKDLLTPSVMKGVTVRTILEAEESTENYSYAKGTLEEYKVNTANRTLDFEVTGPTRYQLGELSARLWVEISPELSSVEWYKNNVTTGNKTTKLTVSNVGKSQVGTYHAVVNGTRLSDINIVVEDYMFEFTGEDGDSTATISEYLGTDTDISLPSSALNYEKEWEQTSPVTAIRDSEVTWETYNKDGVFYNKNLTSVDIPDSIRSIGIEAFKRNKLTSVNIPVNVTIIGWGAFNDNELTSITIPNNVTSIESYAFSNNKLTSVTLPDSLTSIEGYAFLNNKLTSVTLPDSLTSIGGFVFSSSPLETIKISSDQIDRIKNLLTPGVMNGVTVRTILETEEGFSYTETTQAVNNLVEGESTQFGIDGKRYQLDNIDSRSWEEWTYQWMKAEIELNNTTRQFDLTNVTESDAGLYHAVVGEGEFSEILPDLEVNIIPRQDREIPNTNPENPSINPTDPNPEISALGIRYVSSFTFGEIPFSKNQREVTSTELVDTEGNPMPHMITIQDAREKANRNGWELRVKQESKMMDGSELILNPYVHEKNSEQYGVNVPSTDLILNEESQRVASVEGDGNSYEPGIFSIGLSGSENEGVRLSIPSGIGVGKYNTTLTWNLIEGP